MNSQHLYKQAQRRKQDRLTAQTGLVGDGIGNVQTGRRGYIWVRLDSDGSAIMAYNDQVAEIPDLPVVVGEDPRQPGTLRVISVRSDVLESAGGAYSAPHGVRHGWLEDDTTPVDVRQILQLRPTPVDLTLYVHPGFLYCGGQMRLIGSAGANGSITPLSVDMRAYLPTVDGKERWVLVTITTSGTLAATAGSLVDIGDLDLDDRPAAPAATQVELCLVRLYYGQTAVHEAKSGTDLIDLRWMARSVAINATQLQGRDISTSAPSDGDALTWDADLAAWVPAAGGGGDLSQSLLAWTEAYELLTATYDADGVLESGTVRWPDGSTGAWTRTTKNATWLAVDAYTVTHVTGGKTVTQAAVTRDANGNITAKPALTIT